MWAIVFYAQAGSPEPLHHSGNSPTLLNKNSNLWGWLEFLCMELSCLALRSDNNKKNYQWKEFQDIPEILIPIFFISHQNLCIENKKFSTIRSQDILKNYFEAHLRGFMDSFVNTVLVWDEYGFTFSETERMKVEEINIDKIIKDGLNDFYPDYRYDYDGLAASSDDDDIVEDIVAISKSNPNTRFYLLYSKVNGKEPIHQIWRIRSCHTLFVHKGISSEEYYCGLNNEGFYGKVSKRNIILTRGYARVGYSMSPSMYFYLESCLNLDFNSQNLKILKGGCSLNRCEENRFGEKIVFTWVLRPLIKDSFSKAIADIYKNRQDIELRDNKITFDEVTHTYTVDGKILQSVTNIVENCFPKFDAELHAKYTAAKMGITPEKVIMMWEQKGKESRELGTAMHKKIENYYKGQDSWEDDSYRLFKMFAEKVKLEPYRTEWAVYDLDHNIAGTIDFVDYQNGEYTIYDWKRSDKIIANGMPVKVSKYQEKGLYPLEHLENCAYYHYALQLSLYKFILERNYNMKISKLRLGIFHPTYDKPYVLEVPYLENEVNTLMGLRSEVIF